MKQVPSGSGVALRYWHTLRYLKPMQIVGRARRLLPYQIPSEAPTLARRKSLGPWCGPALRTPSMQGPQTFRFLNRTGQLASAKDWNAAHQDKLWLYNLHYFDDLNAVGSAERGNWHRTLIGRWIAENPPGHGNGWEPYPLSLRIVNWIKWILAGNDIGPIVCQSLTLQARFLRRHIEWHLLGNHLLANAKALLFAGLFFDGKEAAEWLKIGQRILEDQVREQMLADGGHFELSPMYHAIVLEDLLDLVNISRAYPGLIPEATIMDWLKRIGRMRSWLAAMLHPDGGVASFNDSAHGIAASPSELSLYAQRLALTPVTAPTGGIVHLSDSGYVRIQQGDITAFLDVGPIGPDYLPGHAHADSLSFELSLGGARVFVNSGTSLYKSGPARDLERSTEAHNTVVVDGANSSEVWDSFRVARRARPFGLKIEEKGDAISVRCAHDGYRRLPGRVTHWREWRFRCDGFTITDQLEGGWERATSYFHLHPDLQLSTETGTMDCLDGRLLTYGVKNGRPAVIPYKYHPEFGLSQAAACLSVAFDDSSCATEFRVI